MASAAQSIRLLYDESIGSSCLGPGVTRHARFHKRRALNSHGVAPVKIYSISTRSKLNSSSRNFCCFVSRCSTLLSRRMEKISSSFYIGPNKREVAPQGLLAQSLRDYLLYSLLFSSLIIFPPLSF